jgi:hypothetical protein
VLPSRREPIGTKKGRKYWEGIIDTWRESGKPQRAFCRAKKISYWSFRYWKKMIENQEADGKSEFVEILAPPKQSRDSKGISIRIIFPSGIMIEPGTVFDERELVAAIRAVRNA